MRIKKDNQNLFMQLDYGAITKFSSEVARHSHIKYDAFEVNKLVNAIFLLVQHILRREPKMSYF